MPKVISYTPAWLSRTSPGFDLFQDKQKPAALESTMRREVGPLRTIAHRGSQLYVAVGNELRWSDLRLLETRGSSPPQNTEEASKLAYRALKIPASKPIKQLIISPAGDYLAILTSHTVHVALLPDASHLASEDTTPLRIKTLHVGPTTHVLERSPIAAALWHPLGNHGSCLVTITKDAIVRVWELDRSNRWSYDVPALAIDLKKLADGGTSAEDFSPSKYGANKGYSPDSFDMEVSSACFGGSGQENEMPWSSMTLWVAMRGGDIYALCPLLPSRWQTSPSLIANLTAHIHCDSSSRLSHDSAESSKRIAEQQNAWLSEIDLQQDGNDPDSMEDTYTRPKHPSPIPMLQGPFQIPPDADEVFDITDIFVMPATEDSESVAGEFEDDEAQGERLASSIVCLATSDETIHVCLDIDGVSGRWLPSKQSPPFNLDGERKQPELLLVESLELSESVSSPSWPQFTQSPHSESCLFVSHSQGISMLEVSGWTTKLANEVDALDETGAGFRIDLLVQNSQASLNHLTTYKNLEMSPEVPLDQPAACISLLDAELGLVVLGEVSGQPYAAILDDSADGVGLNDRLLGYSQDADDALLVPFESRPSYQAPKELWQDSTFTQLMDRHVHSRHKWTMSESVRMSPATLDLLMEAHRILSHETRQLGMAAADLFRRCERLQDEFQTQIRRDNEVANRIDAVLDDDPDRYGEDEEVVPKEAQLSNRLEMARERSEGLTERYANLRRKLGHLTSRPLSEKEIAWANEIKAMNCTACDPEKALEESSEELPEQVQLWQRFGKLRRMEEQLLEQWEEHKASSSSNNPLPPSSSSSPSSLRQDEFVVSPEKRKAGWKEISTLLERQTTLMQITKQKLEKLSLVPV